MTINKITDIIDELKSAKENNISLFDLDVAELIECLEFSKKEINTLSQKVNESYQRPVIDRKFIFLALNPYTGNYYSQKDAFIMTAKDLAVPAALKAYIDKCKELGASADQINSAILMLKRILDYQKIHPTKVPDISSDRERYACIKGELINE